MTKVTLKITLRGCGSIPSASAPRDLQRDHGRGRAGVGPGVEPQVDQRRVDAPLGGRPQHLLDIGVHQLDDLPGGARAALDSGLHLGQALGPMIEVVPDHPLRLIERRSVPGQQHSAGQVLDHPVEAAQRVQVGAERAVRVVNHRRAPAEHGIAGEHDPVLAHNKAQGVAGVARSGEHVQSHPAGVDDVTLAQALRTESVRRIERPDADATPLRESSGPGAVVEVAVGEQHVGDPHPAPGHAVLDGAQVLLVVRTGIDHHGTPAVRGAEHPGVGSVESQRRGVAREHAVRDRRYRTARPGHGHRSAPDLSVSRARSQGSAASRATAPVTANASG